MVCDHEKRADEIQNDMRPMFVEAITWARALRNGYPVVGQKRKLLNFDDGEVKAIAVGGVGVGVFSVYPDGAVRLSTIGEPNTPFGKACKAFMLDLLDQYVPHVMKQAKVIDRTGDIQS